MPRVNSYPILLKIPIYNELNTSAPIAKDIIPIIY